MKRIFIALQVAFVLAFFHGLVGAQTVVNITSQTCNVANTECVLQGDGGQVVKFEPVTGAMDVGEVGYTVTGKTSVVVLSTNYKHVNDVTFTFTPTAELDGMYIGARSGSGRGGWAWHYHWLFTTLTIY